MSSIIDESIEEHVNMDPDPSATRGAGGRRIRRGTVFAVIMTLGVLCALAVLAFLLATMNARRAQAATARPDDPTSQHTGANPSAMTYNTEDTDQQAAQTATSAKRSPLPEQTYIPDHDAQTGSAAGAGDGTPTQQVDPATQEAQNEEVERQRAEFAVEQQRATLGRDAIGADMRIATTSSQEQSQPSDGAAPPAPPAAPTAQPGLITKTSGRFKIRKGDWFDAQLMPNLNPELRGYAMVCVTSDIKDSATGTLTLVPQYSCAIGIPGGVTAGQERISLEASILYFPLDTGQVDLAAVAADPDGTPGIGAHVDDHRQKVLSIAAIGGGLSGLATLMSPSSLSSGGLTINAPSAQSQVLGGAGASVLQTAAGLAQAQMTRPPTLTAPRAKHIILYIEQDLYLDPYCDPELPNSPECIAKGALSQQ